MAFRAYTDNIFIDLPQCTCGGFCDISGRVAYKLWCDSSDESNVKIRIDLTYIHVKVAINDARVGSGYFNGCVLSWFDGHYRNMFNETQFNLNNDRNADGSYKHSFDWPYNTAADGGYSDTYPYQRTWWQRACNDTNKVVYNGNPILGITYSDSITYFGGKDIQRGTYASNISQSGHDAVFWGDCFRDAAKFNGTNLNNLPRFYVDGKTIHVSSSSCTRKSDKKRLYYNDDLATSASDLTIDSPYSGNENSGDAAICSITMSTSDMDKQGLIKYDIDYFKDKIDTNYDPYVFHGFICPLTWWVRWRTSTGPSKITLASDRTAQQITLKQEDFDVPTPVLPDPIKPLDDNTVYRLKSTTDSSGNKVVDKNGYVVLTWTKCERIGKES